MIAFQKRQSDKLNSQKQIRIKKDFDQLKREKDMQLLEIEQPEFAQILTRNSITQSNFLQENIYIEEPRLIIKNKQYIAWVKEDCLDLEILRQKLETNDLKKPKRKLYRTELRYLITSDGSEVDLDYHEKYKTYKLGSVLQNERVHQLDISQHFLVALTNDGHIVIINMLTQHTGSSSKSNNQLSSNSSLKKQQQHQINALQSENDHKSKIEIKYKKYPFVRIIMAENESDRFYALDEQNNLFAMSLLDGQIYNIFFIQNYNLFIGNHDGERIRLIKLGDYGYLLYSHQNFLFYIETKDSCAKCKQTVSVKKSHFARDLEFNLIISQFNNSIFMINNSAYNRQYLLFASDIAIDQNTDQLFTQITKYIFSTHKDTATPTAQQFSKGGTSIEQFISKFESKKQIFQSIKDAWSLKICKLFNNSEYYHYFFSNYVVTELEQYINKYQLSILEFLQVSVLLLVQIKPSLIELLLSQLEIIINDSRVKNEVWLKIWEFMPLYDVSREQAEPDYKQSYINISKILGTEREISFLLKEI